MAFLTYQMLASLDGYANDTDGRFDWAEPSEEVHAVVNDLSRGAGTFLLGRRMYEVLLAWETMDQSGQPTVVREFTEIWHDADKIVYSRSLADAPSARTRIERRFDPVEVGNLKATAERDLMIGGPTLAAAAFTAGLIDRIDLFLFPVIVGGGTRALPEGVSLSLDLVDERRYGDGTVSVHHHTRA